MGQEQIITGKQDQQLVMTPQLQQSIKILQLNQLDLVNYISEQLEQNPLLENDDNIYVEDHDTNNEKINDVSDIINEKPSEDINDRITDDNFSKLWEKDNNTESPYTKISNYNSNYSIDDNEDKNITLRSFIMDQASLEIQSPEQIIIATHLIDMLDDSGYLTEDYMKICNILKCKPKEVKQVLSILQSFEPAGIFARSLSECLALQLKDLNRFDPIINKLLKNLDLLAEMNISKLCHICGADKEEMIEMIQEIKSLNPRPGSIFSNEVTENVIPDIFLKKVDGKWVIELNSEALPRILINNNYVSNIRNYERTDKKEIEYLNSKINEANWLIKALDQRAKTILKISTEIVKIQEDFFDNGIHNLKALTMSELAELVDMHPSTVGRVKNKIIQTNTGSYELKYFFSSSISKSQSNTDISQVASTSVKHIIKKMIDNETIDCIFSDNDIVNELLKQDIKIARRTVAKYREELKIPKSTERRKLKKNIS